jgi:hypothetical protein
MEERPGASRGSSLSLSGVTFGLKGKFLVQKKSYFDKLRPAPLMPLVAFVLLPPQKDDLSSSKVRPGGDPGEPCGEWIGPATAIHHLVWGESEPSTTAILDGF